MRSKKELEVQLSKLKGFTNPSWELEQYETPSSIAAEWIWSMAMKGEVAGKNIADLACGPGIIGIGLLLMGAKKVYFLDNDQKIVQTCIENYNKVKEEYEISEAEFIVEDVSLFDHEVDIIVQNPPFGTKDKHADKRFLETAFRFAPIVYSMHKYSTAKFIEAISKDHGFRITDLWRYQFPIKASFEFHKKPVKSVDVGLWRFQTQDSQ